MKVSIVIIVKDGARTIARVLEQAKLLSDDVILLDTGSTDQTSAIARSLGVSLIDQSWLGYGATKNAGNHRAKHEWILSLDADEVMDDELINEIDNCTGVGVDIYRIRIQNYIGNIAVRHCGWRSSGHMRLFRKSLMWNDNEVHEKLLTTGNESYQTLKNIIHHYSYADASHYLSKQKKYAELKAEMLIRQGRSPSWWRRHIGWVSKFLTFYVWKRGILSGKMGWYISKNEADMVQHMVKYYDLSVKDIK